MTTFELSLSEPLTRFVVDGLLATLASHRAGELPLHRVAWELRIRLDTLAELHPPARTLTRLRWLQLAVQRLHEELLATGRAEPTETERARLIATLDSLTAVLATLVPRDPFDPPGVAPAVRGPFRVVTVGPLIGRLVA